jgi:DUF1680 family protein
MGHYLSALSLMYASTGDERFKQRVDYLVGELAKCQSNSPAAGFHAGYLSAFPESFIERVEQGKPVWAPWYTLHKIMAGLLDANHQCGNAQALVVLTNMANWVKFRVDGIPRGQMQKSLDMEQGGMNEVLANLFGATGDTNYLALSAAFNHAKILDQLALGEDKLNGLHANTQIPKLIGATREYEFTGDANFLKMACTFWSSVALERSYVIGGDSDHEHFFPTNQFDTHLDADTCETCNTYNMLKLTRELFALEPDPAKMDFYERGLYNHILASQDPETGMFVYLMSLKPGHFKTYSTPEDSFWCCVGTGMENHSKYGDTIYFHNADSLYVNLFIASELTWPEKSLSIQQRTGFPEDNTTALKIKTAKPAAFSLKIRHPAWATGDLKISINGKRQKTGSAPGSYVTLQREWHDGDVVNVELPMKLRMEFLPDNTNEVAVLYGPIVLAGVLGTNLMPSPFATTQTEFDHVPDPGVPMLAASTNDLLNHIKPITGRPLTFQTSGIGRPVDVTMIPFYEMHHQRYSVYWRLITDAYWREHATDFAVADARRMAQESQVVDTVRPGEPQSEIDHKWRGEGTQTGDAFGFKWRQANGWFSYEVKVISGQPQQLAVSLRGGTKEAQNFDLTVDGKVLAASPGKEPELIYSLPPELTQGRQNITVKFVAHPGRSISGLTGLRVIKI